jgi:hypothetical protein
LFNDKRLKLTTANNCKTLISNKSPAPKLPPRPLIENAWWRPGCKRKLKYNPKREPKDTGYRKVFRENKRWHSNGTLRLIHATKDIERLDKVWAEVIYDKFLPAKAPKKEPAEATSIAGFFAQRMAEMELIKEKLANVDIPNEFNKDMNVGSFLSMFNQLARENAVNASLNYNSDQKLARFKI